MVCDSGGLLYKLSEIEIISNKLEVSSVFFVILVDVEIAKEEDFFFMIKECLELVIKIYVVGLR